MARRSRELSMFETLENLTKHESFDSTASFVKRFVNCNLDLNNTHQSIVAEEEEDILRLLSSIAEGPGGGGGPKKSGLESDDDVQIVSESDYDNQLKSEGLSDKIGDDMDDSYESITDGDVGDGDEETRFQSEDELNELYEVIKRKKGMEMLLLSEMKRTLELQESQLEHEKRTFLDKKKTEQSALETEKKRVATQKKNLQSLITDYHKIKSSRDEYEGKMKELTEKLRETKLEMGKRISRWGDQQKKLEERVKALEKENESLKKQKGCPPRRTALKRPSMLGRAPPKPTTKQLKRIQFADDVNEIENQPEKKEQSSAVSNASSEESHRLIGNPKRRTERSILNSTNHSTDNDSAIVADISAEDSKYLTISDLEHHDADTFLREVDPSDEGADKAMPSEYIEVKHPCGTITRVTKDGRFRRHVMVNNDIMDEMEDCSVRYYYHEQGFSQTTYPNGDEIIEYDSGVLETSKSDGSKIYTFSNGLVKMVDSKGLEEIYFADGSVMTKESKGECTIIWPNGQKEIRTQEFSKRIFTNGTVKIMYSDGSLETRYWNGRIRRRDKNGVLVDDTKPEARSKSTNGSR